MTHAVAFRPGLPNDALCIGVLATHVFLSTYAADGIRPELAREALTVYSQDAFASRLADRQRRFVLAESDRQLVAFLELALDSACPVADAARVEVVRLYVHPRFHRRRIGQALSAHAETMAAHVGGGVWLTAWAGNAGALAFYRALGYEDIGATTYAIEGRHYDNRVLRKRRATG